MSTMKEVEKYFSGKTLMEIFLKKREIFLWAQVDEETSEELVKKILLLDSEGKEDIKLYINSPGGSISAGLAIYDAMQNSKSDVSTICTGQAASMGAVLLASGEKGKRFAWPHARIMIHQPLISGHIYAPASDIKIQAEEMLRMRKELNEILAKHTGKNYDQISKDTDRDYFLDPIQAKEYGLIDGVLGK